MIALQTHLVVQQPTYLENVESVLAVLFNAYNGSSGFDNTAIKADFEELFRLMNGKPLQEIEAIIYAVCTLCRNHEKTGFFQGVKVGMSLAKEIYPLCKTTGQSKGCPVILDNHASKSAYWDKALTARSSVVRDSLPKDICPS